MKSRKRNKGSWVYRHSVAVHDNHELRKGIYKIHNKIIKKKNKCKCNDDDEDYGDNDDDILNIQFSYRATQMTNLIVNVS